MLPYRDSRLTKIVIAVFFIVIAGYAYFEARGILYGPRIEVPEAVSQVNEQFITLRGRADRIAVLNMNGKPISVTEDGTFEEPYLLSPGLNRIVFDAEDKYGRKRQEVIQVVYVSEHAASPAQAATTTPQDLIDTQVASTTL
jgi:uncharacterized protein YfaP (DUF2135 family)